VKRTRKSLEERLWALIEKRGPTDCWYWQGGKAGKGYGTIKKEINGRWKTAYAHREILRLIKGDAPFQNAHALHSCDTPSCCNPAHLSWGTNSQNRKEARDRLHNQGKQKLTPEQVNDIRNMSGTYLEIAEKFSIHFDTVARIKRNRSWQP